MAEIGREAEPPRDRPFASPDVVATPLQTDEAPKKTAKKTRTKKSTKETPVDPLDEPRAEYGLVHTADAMIATKEGKLQPGFHDPTDTAGILAWLNAGPFDIAWLAALLDDIPPPQALMERESAREQLIAALKGKAQSPARLVDVWMKQWETPAKDPAPVPSVEMPDLAREPAILDAFSKEVAGSGLVGERNTTRLLFLAMTSRVLPRPVSVVVKGVSAGGKSYAVQCVLDFFPPHTYWSRSALSPRALVYTTESFVHRMFVLFEAESIQGEDSGMAAYLIRSLLSEGRLMYETVIDSEAVMLDKPGPTGLITTTTATALHPENETRMFSVTVADTREQTRAVMQAIAEEREAVDRSEWHQLSDWIEQEDNRVTIPYARVLAGRIPPVAVRMRRDFAAILTLIRAHAVLHQHNRGRDDDGRIVALPEDYAVVRELVNSLASEGTGLSVPQTIRETVDAVADLLSEQKDDPFQPEGVTGKAVGVHLGLDKSAAKRRLDNAVAEGYVKNLEDRRFRPGRYVLDDPMPDTNDVAPLLPEGVEGV
jgi:hypothetical protein